jgi:ketosteroid isomerase-like protein
MAAQISETDVQAITNISGAHVRAVLDHDPDAYLATCTDDMTFLPPGLPALVGQSACRDFLDAFPKPSTFHAETHEIFGQGDFAYCYGSGTARIGDADVTFKWIQIYRRGSDSAWKLSREIWNSID